MQEAGVCLHQLEWPPPGTVVRGPVLWLSGWAVGRNGHDLTDVRVRTGGASHWGVLGLPRTDLAAHFAAPRPWLPAGFFVGVPVAEGATELVLEARDAFGRWHAMQTLSLRVSVDGQPSPREEGRLLARPDGTWTVRGAHLPFHGHLDDPAEKPAGRFGRTAVFGWLLHEQSSLAAVRATADLLVFNQLTHGVTDEALAAKVSEQPQARHARLQGAVDTPPTLPNPACLRVYAELADGSVHLCFASRHEFSTPNEIPPPPVPLAIYPSPTPPVRLAAFPSRRPRRLLLATLNLQSDEATCRALDVARHLIGSGNWVVRLVAAADGPLRQAFQQAGVSVQIVDPRALFVAADAPAVHAAQAALERQLWLKHLDAIAVFDPLCFWLAPLGRKHGTPTLFDCSADRIVTPPPDASPALAKAMRIAWRSFDRICLLFPGLGQPAFAGVPERFIPPWYDPSGPVSDAADQPRPFAVAPIRGTAEHGAYVLLRAADELARRHPAFQRQWRMAVTGLRETNEERRFAADAAFNQPAIMAVEFVPLDRAALCVCPAFGGHPFRALLSAAAAGVPVVTTACDVTRGLFGPHEVAFVAAGQPGALAHTLAAFATNPDEFHRRAAVTRPRVQADHAPLPLLGRWRDMLESLVALRT